MKGTQCYDVIKVKGSLITLCFDSRTAHDLVDYLLAIKLFSY